MHLSLTDGSTERDLTLHDTGSDATADALYAAAGLDAPGGRVEVDGRTHGRGEPLATLALHQGSVIGPARPAGAAVARVARVAGGGSGRAHPVGPGTYDLGRRRGPGPGVDAAARVTVEVDGRVRFQALGPGARVLDDEHLEDEDGVYRVRPETGAAARPVRVEADGRVAFARAPRLDPPEPTVTIEGPRPPAPPRPPQPLSWVLLVAPIPFGLVMAYFFSPFFLAFTLMSPIMSVARWWDGKRQVRKGEARVERETARLLAEVGVEASEAARAEAARRRRAHLDLDGLARMAATGSNRLWEVRSGHRDHLHLTVGLGSVPWQPDVTDSPLPGLAAAVAESSVLVNAPARVDLGLAGGLGVVGPPERARAVAAALLSELVVRHGPADVELGALLGDAAVAEWDHLKWLPHLVDDVGHRRVATAEAGPSALLPDPPAPGPGRLSAPPPSPSPTRVVLIDDEERVATGLPEVASAVNAGRAAAVVVADRAVALPSFCRMVLEVGADGRGRLIDTATGDVVQDVIAAQADRSVARAVARSLARFVDPEAATSAALLPATCHLGELVGGDVDRSVVARSWDHSPSGLEATLGVAEHGPFRIDLVRDGPHALVAGTTGSGKSELLRTLIASLAVRYDPTAVNFVLVDFKGGGAFDACADLPHTVGVVTDLDEHLAERALRCLRAELTHRERFLRTAGVSDLAQLPPGPQGLPRLMIVVDEFATLAAELPDFMTSLVDVAQRGRSLGIHMVLATQRPTGVVDAKIRANTNLRIALRVQDDRDSSDVIGSPEAAAIHRSQAGRALARLGADELVTFQTAIVSFPPPRREGGALRVTPFRLVDEPAAVADPDDGDDGDRPPEVVTLTEAATAEAGRRGLPAPRVPWPPALPDRLTAAELAELDRVSAEPGRWSSAWGLVDLPDEQRQAPLRWSAADGHTLLFGIDPEPMDNAVVALCAGLAATHGPDRLHLYAADFSGGLAALDDLPQAGARVGPQDDELLARLLQLVGAELEVRQARQREERLARLGPEDAPLFVLAISNYAGLLEHLDEQGDTEGPARLAALIRDGAPLGMIVVATGLGERGIPMRVAAQVPTKFVFRLADRMAYTSFGLRAKDVPDLGPGRAIDTRSGAEVQFVTSGLDTAVTMAATTPPSTQPSTSSSTQPSTQDRVGRGGPRPLRALPRQVAFAEVAVHSTADGDRWDLALGLAHHDLEPVGLELRPGVHTVVTGPPGSGRSTALDTIARAASGVLGPGVVHRVGADPATGGGGAHGRTVSDPRTLFELGAEPGLVLVDDIELLAPDLVSVIEKLATDPRSRARLVVAGRIETFKGIQPLNRALTAARSGVLLQPPPDAGDVFRLRMRPLGPQPAGRGYILRAGVAHLAQLALPGAGDAADGPVPTGGEGTDPIAPEPTRPGAGVDNPPGLRVVPA